MIWLSERWIKRQERILERLKALETKDMDRLDHVRTLRSVLGSLWSSLSGWMQWINNPDIMTRYSKEELEEMSNEITDFVKSFIEYDLKVTRHALEKGITQRREGRLPRQRTGRPPDRLII